MVQAMIEELMIPETARITYPLIVLKRHIVSWRRCGLMHAVLSLVWMQL